MITRMFDFLFGEGRNVLAETAEVFRENTEAGAKRQSHLQNSVLAQYAAEFAHPKQGAFDRFMDGLNRVPRPALALGTLALFLSAMIDPIWFAARMQGIALVPEPLWWLLGAIVSFYFGARHQTKGQAFQKSIASSVALAQSVNANLAALEALEPGSQHAPDPVEDASSNPALEDWRNKAKV